MKSNSIVWFRQDLRVMDNPSIHNAAISSNILPVYIYDNDIPKNLRSVVRKNGGYIKV